MLGNKKGINVKILGDSGPFSKMGKSIGYLLSIGDNQYMIDCGAQVFQSVGGHGLKDIKGFFVTHCHDDHMRWLGDIAIFFKYAPDIDKRVSLITSEDVAVDLLKMMAPALEKTLSPDQKSIVDVSLDDYFDLRIIGPKARYTIISKDEGNGISRLCIVDSEGREVSPQQAKIVINPATGRPRMLFRDPSYGEWIEPELFYPFSSKVFYEDDINSLQGDGYVIDAVKSPVWHGVPGIGIRIKTENEILIFSSDTVHDLRLWERLYKERRIQKLDMSRREFEKASVIYGDINDYIERVWSEERFIEAVNIMKSGVVFHDISIRDAKVHTCYSGLENTILERETTLLTHSPDRITSEWPLCFPGKEYRIEENRIYEVVNGALYPLNADIYHKEEGRFFVGYKNKEGLYSVYEKDGILFISKSSDGISGKRLFSVDLYEDIGGRYYPKIEGDVHYRLRSDGMVEIVKYTDSGSTGKVVNNVRDRLVKDFLSKTLNIN